MRKLLPAIFLFITVRLFSQDLQVLQLSTFDEYWLNPALTGKDVCTSARLIDRHQWLGIKEAPSMQSLGVRHTLYDNYQRHGMGAMVYRDKNGLSSSLGLYADYAFHVIISRQKDIMLSFGLRPGIMQASVNQGEFTPGIEDPAVIGNNVSEMIFDAATGFVIYNPKFSAGFAVSHLIPGQNYNQINLLEETSRLYVLHIGYHYKPLTGKLAFEPSVYAMANENFWKQVMVHAKLIYESVWAMGSFQTLLDNNGGNSGSFAGAVGYTYEKYTLGYQFEIGLSQLQTRHFGSHSVMLQYRFCKEKILCPVYKER